LPQLHNHPVTPLMNRVRVIAVALMTVLSFLSIPAAAADPPPQGGAHISDVEHVNERWDKVSVYSPAMDKVIVNDVS
jgi:diacylglycerol O-acyltransferase/trehalose O-mycolyltransferase